MVEVKVKSRGITVKDEVTRPNGETAIKTRFIKRGEILEVTEDEAADGIESGDFVAVDDAGEVVVESTEIEVVELSDDELDEWLAGNLTDKAPTIGELVDHVADAEDAERVLAAENRVAAAEDRDVRVGLEKGLADIIGATTPE